MRISERVAVLLAPLVWLFTQFLGWSGILLLLYSVATHIAGETWRPMETWAPFVSSLLTLLGTALTAASVYFVPNHQKQPWKHSKAIVAPLVILASVAAIILLFRKGGLSQVTVSAFGLLAIAGGLQRLLSFPTEHPPTTAS